MSAMSLWDEILARVEAKVNRHSFATWFRPTTAVSLQGETLTVRVPNPQFKEWLAKNYQPVIDEALLELGRGDVRVAFESEAEAAPSLEAAAAERDVSALASLNPKYTFESFVVGSSNQFAHAASRAVAEIPSKSYNPLFLYGGVGLGKTHLLQAIAHYVSENYPDKVVRYVSSEKFLNEFVESIRNQTGNEFQKRWREVDVLLVDDIQFIERAERFQEEFFHTFNELHDRRSQIVLTSDRAPDAIATLEKRLRSRFMMGLITDIQPPDVETRIAILRKKAEKAPSAVPDEVLDFIAENITDNIRELEGALTRVSAYANLYQQRLDVALAQRILSDILGERQPRPVTPQAILDKTADMFGFTVEEIQGKSRRRPLVTARQVAMYVMRELTDLSYPAIAREFGGRDHTTVIHAVDKISRLMPERKQVFHQVQALVQDVKKS